MWEKEMEKGGEENKKGKITGEVEKRRSEPLKRRPGEVEPFFPNVVNQASDRLPVTNSIFEFFFYC